jgi:hypothetical protein
LLKNKIVRNDHAERGRFCANNARCVRRHFRTLVTMSIKRFFVEHPASVDESYREHFRVAAGFAGSLAVASAAAAVHALVPGLCTTTASGRITALHERMTSGRRGSAQQPGAKHPVRAA